LANLRESFARTALQLVQKGKPFTSTLTTRRFMLTPRLMMLYAYLDAIQVTTRETAVDCTPKAHPASAFHAHRQERRDPPQARRSIRPAPTT